MNKTKKDFIVICSFIGVYANNFCSDTQLKCSLLVQCVTSFKIKMFEKRYDYITSINYDIYILSLFLWLDVFQAQFSKKSE